MKKISKFIILVATSSSILLTAQQSLSEEITEMGSSKKIIKIEEKIRPGVSLEHPIILKGAKNYAEIKSLQREYIRKNYEGYNILAEFFMKDKNEHFIQHFLIHDDDGNAAHIFFDISDVCKKASKQKKKENKELIERMKMLDSSRYSANK